MRLPLFVLTALAACGLCAPAPGSSHAAEASSPRSLKERQAAPARATWLWESTIISDATAVGQFISFAQSNGVSRVHVQIDPDIANSNWQSFISRCSAAGITVDALMGNMYWVVGSGSPSLQSGLDWITQFQNSAPSGAKFTGIHVDVEPWGFSDWDANQATYIAGWQNVFQNIVAFGKQLGMPVAADLPFWAYTLTSPTTGQTMDVWLLNILDSATFMTYRDTAAGVLSLTQPILNTADALRKPVWFAVETTEVGEANVSYYGKSAATLRADLDTITNSARGDSNFAGITVHDYNGWRAMN